MWRALRQISRTSLTAFGAALAPVQKTATSTVRPGDLDDAVRVLYPNEIPAGARPPRPTVRPFPAPTAPKSWVSEPIIPKQYQGYLDDATSDPLPCTVFQGINKCSDAVSQVGVDGCSAAQVVKKAPLKRAAPPSTKAPAVKKRPPPEGTRLLPAWALHSVVNEYLTMSVLSVKACSAHAHSKEAVLACWP